MDVLEYLSPSAIPDFIHHRTVAKIIVPIRDESLHQDSLLTSSTTNSNSTSDKRIRQGSIDASTHMTTPASFAATSSTSLSSSYSHHSPFGFITGPASHIFELASSITRMLPKSAAALQRTILQTVPVLWTISPPPLHVSVLETETSRSEKNLIGSSFCCSNSNNNSENNNNNMNFNIKYKSCPQFVALHPHRRLMAVAVPREGASKHGAILIYDLSNSSSSQPQQQQQQTPKQVIRNILIKDLCGIEWKTGSRNILIAYGQLGVAMFHLSVDPRSGLDVEWNNNISSNNTQNINNNNMMGYGSIIQDSLPPLVLPSAGSVAENNHRDLGVACLYPVGSQLARFGISPQVDRISFFSTSSNSSGQQQQQQQQFNGRFLACGSTESSGIRIIDTSYSPMEQLYKDWRNSNNSTGGSTSIDDEEEGRIIQQQLEENVAPGGVGRDTSSDNSNNRKKGNHQKKNVIAGTFVGSPSGGTQSLAWLPRLPLSKTILLMRAVKDCKEVDVFAAGIAKPVSRLTTPHPVEQLVVSSSSSSSTWPMLNAAERNAFLPDIEPRPNRHVPVWFLYEKTEGVVLNCVSYNEHKIRESPMFVTALIRLSTTCPPRSPSSHPGGRVTRMSCVKESCASSQNSGTVLMSVESGHVIAVKISKIVSPSSLTSSSASQQQQKSDPSSTTAGNNTLGNNKFVAQTVLIASADDQDEDEEDEYRRNNNRSGGGGLSAELVGTFGGMNSGGNLDSFSLVTWNGQDGVAKIVTVTGNKTEVSAAVAK